MARHEGRMREPAGGEEKLSVRGYLEAMAERGGPEGAKAAARLEGPEVPAALEYLWRWFLLLDGMRTYGMAGPHPLSADVILAADRLYGWGLEPHEVDGIRALDAALRHPGEDETTPEPVEAPAWPTKKG